MKTSVPPYFSFPFPNFYEEIHREAISCLNVETFEGLRVDVARLIRNKVNVCNSTMAGPTTPYPTKIFKANYADSKLMFLVKIKRYSRLYAKFKYDFAPNLAVKANVQLAKEPYECNGLINFEYKNSVDNVQFHMGSGGLLAATYMNAIRPGFSFGGELFREAHHTKHDVAYVARYDNGKTIATGHHRLRSGVIALSYVHKVNPQFCLASDFFCNYNSQDIRASFGFCVNVTNSRGYVGHDNKIVMSQIKGKIDSDGVVALLVEHAGGAIWSFEFDPSMQGHKIGIGFKNINLYPVFSRDK